MRLNIELVKNTVIMSLKSTQHMLILDFHGSEVDCLDMPTDPLATFLQRAIGRRVAFLRGRLSPKLTQEQLSARTRGQISRSAVANIESGRQRIAVHHLYHLAQALEVEPVELLPASSELPSERVIRSDRIRKDPSAEAFTRLVLGDRASSLNNDDT